MYILKYTSNGKIMDLYGPKAGISLIDRRQAVTEKEFTLSANGARLTAKINGNQGFEISPLETVVKGRTLIIFTKNSVYCFECKEDMASKQTGILKDLDVIGQ